MENIEKVAYLRGMLEGMKFDADSDMGKIVLKLIEIVDDLAHDLTDAEERADVWLTTSTSSTTISAR